jgi:hypothetical protein
MLTALFAIALVAFLAVTGLTHVYYAQRDHLGNRWSARGSAELNAGHYGAAVNDFRAALLYSRDNYSYQLSLARIIHVFGDTKGLVMVQSRCLRGFETNRRPSRERAYHNTVCSVPWNLFASGGREV